MEGHSARGGRRAAGASVPHHRPRRPGAACNRVFDSATRWTVVRGSALGEGDSQGLPVWSRHVGDPVLASDITRRIDFALFMVEALGDDTLIGGAPAIVGRLAPAVIAQSTQTAP